MRTRNTDRALDEAAQGRRDFLRFLAAAPLAVQASAWMIACGGERKESPHAEEKGVGSEEMPEGGATGERATGRAEAGSTAPAAGSAAESPTASSGTGATSGEETAATGGSDEGKLVTEIAAMEPTVTALKYTNQSTTEGQHCEICQFYTATGGGRGKCQLFTQGLVNSQGWCTSWTKKIETS